MEPDDALALAAALRADPPADADGCRGGTVQDARAQAGADCSGPKARTTTGC